MATPTAIVAYLALFAGAAAIFLFVNLVVGRFVRPALPNQEKLEIYECGEPTIGSSFVQFDLRFYVVALLFIIFDVEVAFFFPWATVFGKATRLAAADGPTTQISADADPGALPPGVATIYRELGVRQSQEPTISYADVLTLALERGAGERAIDGRRAELDAQSKEAGSSGLGSMLSLDEAVKAADELGATLTTADVARAAIQKSAKRLAASTIVDIGVFFAVLMVGFFYVWKRGDLDWVRSLQSHGGDVVQRAHPNAAEASARIARPAGSILSA